MGAGVRERDGKFVHEFQLSFESSFWVLYLHAAPRSWGLRPDMSIHPPDFVVQRPERLVMADDGELKITAPHDFLLVRMLHSLTERSR